MADAWHHRVLIWDQWPERNDTPPDRCLGQASLEELELNRGGLVTARSLYWPFGLAWCDGWLWVTDTGNRRVLGWHGLPEKERDADRVLGQDDFESGLENRGRDVSEGSFRWPHAVGVARDHLWVSDTANNRILTFDDRDEARTVLGQPDFESNGENHWKAITTKRCAGPTAWTGRATAWPWPTPATTVWCSGNGEDNAMCLGIPGQIKEIYESHGTRMGRVDFGGILKEVCLAYLPDIACGQYTIVHAGFAITQLDEASAQETLKMFKDLGILEEELAT